MTQEEKILPEAKLWLYCIADARKNEDWDWLDSMPDCFYSALNIDRPTRPEDEDAPLILTNGCWITEAIFYD